MFCRRFAFLTAVFLTQSATTAWADSKQPDLGDAPTNSSKANEAQAASLRAEGLAFVKDGDCKGAIEPLRSAFALREDPATAVPLAECELTLRQEPEAAHHLARAFELLPLGAERTRVETMLQDVSSRLARLDITVNEPDAIVVAGKFVVDAPVQDLFVQPGDMLITVKKSGFEEQSRTVHLTAGKTERLDFQLKQRRYDSELDHPERNAPRGSLIPAYVGAGAAVVLLGVGIGLRVSGTSSGDEADTKLGTLGTNEPCSANPAPKECATIKSLRVDHDQYVNASTGLFVTGGVLLGGALVYGMLVSRKPQEKVAIMPIVSPTNNGIIIQGRF